MKFTPYIYILFLIGINYTVFSQNSKVLHIRGTDSISDIVVRQIAYKKEIANDSLYLEEINLFRDRLEQNGFVQHKIDSVFHNDSIYSVSFTLNESIKQVRLSHNDMPVFAKKLEFNLLNDKAIEIPFIETTKFLKRMTNYFQNNGHPFATISLTNIKKENNTIYADLLIDKNEQRSIDKIIIKGYTNFPKSFVKQSFKIRLNELFNREKITQISKTATTLNFVSEIKKPEMLFTKDSTALYLYLKKTKSNYFDGLIGFSSGQDGKGLKLNGNLDLTINNALNRGESLELNWISDQNKSQSLKLSIKTPYLFNTPLTIGYDFDIFKQDSTHLNISNSIKTDYQLLTNHRIGFVLETQKSNKTATQANSNIVDFSNTFYGLSYSYSKPSYNPVFSKKFYLYSHIAKGNRDEVKQTKISNYLSYLIDISKKQNIVLKNTSEILISDDYLENELFRIGGNNSIRGFDERSLLANSYSFINIEYNYLLSDGSFISALSDFGLLENKLGSPIITTYSFGVGFNQKIKIGQLGIQYMLGNTNRQSFSFDNSKIHVKLSQNF